MTDEKTSEGSAGSPSQSGEAQRVSAIEYLAGEDVPLYSLDELATHLADFIPYLESNSEHLIKFGLPQWSFGPNKWLYYQLGRLYDVKLTGSEWPSYENKAPSPEQLAKMPAYRWIKDASVGEARPSHGYRYCSYGEAALLRCVDAKDAQRLEAGRPNLLELKIATLRVLERALRERDSSKLWNECLGLLRKHRITTDVSETDFFFRMDQQYMPSDVFSDEMADASLKMIPGGLSNLLKVVGHCEKEITLGTLAVTREALEGIINPNKSDQGRFRIPRKHRGEHYAWFVGRPEKGQLDEALDHFLRLWKREPKWWEEYRDRVRKALPSEIHEDVLIRTGALRHHVPHLKAEMESLAEFQKTSLGATGKPFRWMPEAFAAGDETPGPQVAPAAKPACETGDPAESTNSPAKNPLEVVISSGKDQFRLTSKGRTAFSLTPNCTASFLF